MLRQNVVNEVKRAVDGRLINAEERLKLAEKLVGDVLAKLEENTDCAASVGEGALRVAHHAIKEYGNLASTVLDP